MRLSWPTQPAGGRSGVLPPAGASPGEHAHALSDGNARALARVWPRRRCCQRGNGAASPADGELGSPCRGQLLPVPLLWRCLAALRTLDDGVSGTFFGLPDTPSRTACSIWYVLPMKWRLASIARSHTFGEALSMAARTNRPPKASSSSIHSKVY